MLFNKTRAQSLLARENIDGLIAHTPINQYYLSGYWGLFNSAGGYDGAYFSTFSAREDQVCLIIPALEIRRIETMKRQGQPHSADHVFSYFSPLDDSDSLFDDGSPKGMIYKGWQPADGVELVGLEAEWMDAVEHFGPQMSPDAFWALARALKYTSLHSGRVAVDDLRIAMWLQDCNLSNTEFIYAPQLFNEIRLIKTQAELAIMRQAAEINEMSLLAAADSLYEGSTWQEIESIYMQSMAKQGGNGVYLLCGLGELPAEKVRRNEAIMMDGLGKFKHYHGDFGRCVVVGEPTAKQIQYHQAICKGWDVAQQYLKPGVSYGELSSMIAKTVREEGIKSFRDPIVHGVGLEHTDDPKPYGVMPQTKPDQTLQEGMVVNVDLPHSEIGWGSVHMEDTVVITKESFERLSKADFSLRVIQ